MSFAAFNSHTNQIFIDLAVIKVRDLISMYQLKLVYDFMNNQLPNDLMSLFRLSKEVHTTHLDLKSSVNSLLYIPRVNTSTYGLNSIRYKCAKLWNTVFETGDVQIDDDIKNNKSVTDIKNKKHFNYVLKRHFLYSYTVESDVVYY